MRIGVVTFPGSLDDVDALRAVSIAGFEAIALWHAEPDLRDSDAIILPGGFSYGDYLRAGAIARFAPVMTPIIEAAKGGIPVLGIGNGFQMLCEAHLLPGALTRNAHLRYRTRAQPLQVASVRSRWTNAFTPDQELVIPIKHGDGRYVAERRTLDALEAEDRVVFRYLGDNPNGSVRDIAGIVNPAGNVVGMMPHPEHAVNALTGPSTDGLGLFASLVTSMAEV